MIEVLLVLFVIGVGICLFLPASGASREAGRRTLCQNHMRALLGHLQAKEHFPCAGTYQDDAAIHGGDPARSAIYRSIMNPRAFVRDPGPLRSSWVVEILPELDRQDLLNEWSREKSYLDDTTNGAGRRSNSEVARTELEILRCPNDSTTFWGRGNLSYVVNGGFSRWHAIPVGWSGGEEDGQAHNGPLLRWAPPDGTWRNTQDTCRRLGVMFLGTSTGNQPWDIKTRPSDLIDGASQTFMFTENTLAGYSRGTQDSGGLPTNWACPLPNFTMFLASDDVCDSATTKGDCLGGQLRPTPDGKTGLGWNRANQPGTWENVNYGRKLKSEGSFPFANSGHPGGANFGFCDGAIRFLSASIDGSVYARLITPAGASLSDQIRQSQLSDEELGDMYSP